VSLDFGIGGGGAMPFGNQSSCFSLSVILVTGLEYFFGSITVPVSCK
jgi:hypothetical protein